MAYTLVITGVMVTTPMLTNVKKRSRPEDGFFSLNCLFAGNVPYICGRIRGLLTTKRSRAGGWHVMRDKRFQCRLGDKF